MLGSGIGKLSVQIKNSGGTESVWEKSGEQGDKWIQASVDIKSDGPYKVLLIVLAGLLKYTIMMAKEELSRL